MIGARVRFGGGGTRKGSGVGGTPALQADIRQHTIVNRCRRVMAGILFELVVVPIDALRARVDPLASFLAALDVAVDPLDIALVCALSRGSAVTGRDALAVRATDEVRRAVCRDQHNGNADDERRA
ncbi:hypothetical protein AQ476_21230 [Burkholderia thailandensis]|nr:hypothetical protein AQ476_21230 [Burkholderia thailandensis]